MDTKERFNPRKQIKAFPLQISNKRSLISKDAYNINYQISNKRSLIKIPKLPNQKLPIKTGNHPQK